MLLKDFYTLSNLQTSEGLINADIGFNAAHEIFKGHFPTTPVVPGVCMMQMVKEVLEQTIQENTQLSKASHLKFLSVISPTQTAVVQLKLQYAIKEDLIEVQAEMFNSERIFFKMKADFVKKHPS